MEIYCPTNHCLGWDFASVQTNGWDPITRIGTVYSCMHVPAWLDYWLWLRSPNLCLVDAVDETRPALQLSWRRKLNNPQANPIHPACLIPGDGNNLVTFVWPNKPDLHTCTFKQPTWFHASEADPMQNWCANGFEGGNFWTPADISLHKWVGKIMNSCIDYCGSVLYDWVSDLWLSYRQKYHVLIGKVWKYRSLIHITVEILKQFFRTEWMANYSI